MATKTSSTIGAIVTCMMCGSEVGELRGNHFLHNPNCQRKISYKGGRIRCCRCGGSVYGQPMVSGSPEERTLHAEIVKVFREEKGF